MPDPITGIIAGGSVLGGVVSKKSSDKAADAQVEGSEAQAAAALEAARMTNETQRYIFDESTRLTEDARDRGTNALALMSGLAGIGDMPSFGSAGNQLEIKQENGRWHVDNIFGDRIRSFDNLQGAQRMMKNRQFSLEGDPSYQFRLNEGTKAMERSAAARGLRLSGGTLKGIGDYSSGLASQEYGNIFNRAASIAGAGQTATNQQIGAGNAFASGVAANGANIRAAGDARASGYNAIAGGHIGTANALNGAIGDIGGLYTVNALSGGKLFGGAQ